MYEQLLIEKFINVTALEWEAPLLTAPFGDGYGAGLLAGSANGLYGWNLAADALPDWDEYSIDYDIEDVDYSDPRFTYLLEFIQRHIAAGNKPFWFIEPRTKKRYLASFNERKYNFTAITALLYQGGLIIRQRQVRGVPKNPDGSLFAPPDGLKLTQFTQIAVTASWNAATHNSGVTAYEVKFDGIIYNTGLDLQKVIGDLPQNSAHTARVRVLGTDGRVSQWSKKVKIILGDFSVIPTVPQKLAVAAPSANKHRFTWLPSTDDVAVTGYIFNFDTIEINVGNVLFYEIENLAAGSAHTAMVRAYDAAGNLSAYSDPPITFTVAPGVTIGLQSHSILNFISSARSLDRDDPAGRDGLAAYAAMLAYDLGSNNNAVAPNLNAHTVSNFTSLPTFLAADASADDVRDFIAAMAIAKGANNSAATNLTGFTVSRDIAPLRVFNLLSGSDDDLHRWAAAMARDLGAAAV